MLDSKTLLYLYIICTVILSEIIFAQTSTPPSNYGSSDGSESDPYFISSLENLFWLTQNSGEWDKYFEQTTNINASGTSSWDSNQGLSPIGNSSIKFTGTYNGREFSISNLTISRPSTSYVGLFGYTNGATITTLELSNCSITGNSEVGAMVGHSDLSTSVMGGVSSGSVTGTSRVGGLVGENDGSSISMSYSTCTVSGIRSGGLVGYNHTSALISNSYAIGNISGNNTIGGFVGENENNATISECSADGSATASNNFVGGFAGVNKATINKCYSTGSATGASEVGGFVGENYSAGDIDDCYSRGSAIRAIGSSNANIAGFIGRSTVGSPAIDNSYSTGSVTYTGATDPTDKGFCGNLNNGTASNSFFDTETSSQSTCSVATGKTTTEMKTASTFTNAGWSTSIWNIDAGTNDGYPYLDWQNTEGTPLPVELISFTAVKTDEGILLEWETATEMNNYGFEIERQNQDLRTENQYEWVSIGFVRGHGNSNSPKSYSYLDKDYDYDNREKLEYRLKQIDTDGAFVYYGTTAEVNLSVTNVEEHMSANKLPTEFSLSQNYPNPFNPSTTIHYNLPGDARSPAGRDELREGLKVVLKVYDILGNEVAILVDNRQAPGNYQVEFDASTLSTGLFIYKIIIGPFVDVKKMMLIK